MKKCFGGPTIQGQRLAPMHGELPGNQSTKYPKQGLCAIADASLGAVCGQSTT